MPKQYQYSFQVTAEDIDALNHVNNLAFLKYTQIAASKHWELLTNFSETSIVWVARRHEIDYLKQAFLGDELVVLTWVEKFEGIKCKRCYEIKRAEEILVRAITFWVSVDASTMRPKRLSEDLINLF